MWYIGCCDQSKSMKMGVGHDNLLGLKTFAQVWEIIRESKIIPSEDTQNFVIIGRGIKQS